MRLEDYAENDVARYKKKSARKVPAKSNHKHSFQPCILDSYGVEYSREIGFYQVPELSVGTYCSICGKLHNRWFGGYTDEERKQLNPASRTWPMFHVEDMIRTKYVNIEDKR